MKMKLYRVARNGTSRNGIKYTKYGYLIDTTIPKISVIGMEYKFNSTLISVEDLQNDAT